jgi:hypothetical protein
MPLTNEAFANKMMKALRRAGVDAEMRYDAERFAIVSKSRGEFFLGSAYQLYTEASFWKRGGVLKHYAKTMFNAPALAFPKTFDEARGNLVPVIRNTGYLDVAALLAQTSSNKDDGKALRPRFAPLAGTLCFGVAYDSPNALGLFGAQQLDEWGVTFEDAMKAARYNLGVRSRDPLNEVAPGLFMGPWQDANAAGRLVLTELLTRLPVKGDVIAMAPGRDYLFVTGSENAEALGAMVLAAEKAVAAPKPNTPEMFRLQGTAWVPFTLPKDHPLASKHDELVKVFIATDYDEQKKLIDQVYERDEIDVFVANYAPMKRQDGEVISYCSWAPCASLLPRTDVIAVFDHDALEGDGRAPVVVPWNAVIEVVGERLKRDERYRLERYLVEQSPNETEMTELRKRAVAL